MIHEPADVYHARAGEYLSSHLLADFRKCPQLYYRKRLGIIQDEDRPAYAIGRATHTLALEGRDRFRADFTVGGPINPKTNSPFGANTKAFAEWVAGHGKQVLTESQYALVRQMVDSVRGHPLAADLLQEGVAEAVVRTDYCGVPAQIRVDWLNPHQAIVDLKTCDDLTWFEADARRFGYAYQVAFYRAVLAQVIGVAMPVYFIAVEKTEPYRAGVWKVTDDTLVSAQRENEAAIERLKRCQETGVWSTGYEEFRFFDDV